MAFRFRRTIQILPGVRLNIGKNGLSFSVGQKGSSVTLNKSGIHSNVGAPGTGMSFRKTIFKFGERKIEQHTENDAVTLHPVYTKSKSDSKNVKERNQSSIERLKKK